MTTSNKPLFWPEKSELIHLERRRFEFGHQGEQFYAATEPFTHNDRTWYLQVVVSKRFMAFLHRVALPLVRDGIVLFALVSLVAFTVFAFVIFRYTFKPLENVSAKATAISPRSLQARLPTKCIPSEIAPLITSFNQVLDRLEQGYLIQQEFLANAAHELKTPLALIRAQIELNGENNDSQIKDMLADVKYMSRQVQQILLLAEVSESQNYHFVDVRVEDIVNDVVHYLQRFSESENVRVEVSVRNEIHWTADRGAIFTLLKNLLENAIQHSPPNTVVRIKISEDTLTVQDQGVGVDADNLMLLFERFWRAPHRRDLGAGLGLAICKEIALAHGWHIFAEKSDPGLRFRIIRWNL